ncbi:MAG: FAD-dependent oxidoreductase [Nitrosomonadales bacterium]|jgi:glycine/D-amino acid oxidase-like deaminating enzyme|nr:FAD-dependent oxidoreductase [Nitrosomonadales bacterium]
MIQKVNVVVIGCGIFGAEIALKLSSMGFVVKVFEANHDILMGASMNNQNRLHLGFHYPRDIETGIQSIRGFDLFKKKYKECIESSFLNTYFIANENSLTNFDDYLNFCKNLGISFEIIDSSKLPIKLNGARKGITCKEVVYDCEILRSIVKENIKNNDIDISTNLRVEEISKNDDIFKIKTSSGEEIETEIVVNATYGACNYLTEQLGIEVPKRQYEYTAVPIIELDIDKIGITIMDGPFLTILPFGKTNNFLLYHVNFSVIDSEVSSKLNLEWLEKTTSPLSKIDKKQYFNAMIDVCKNFIPALKNAKLIDFLEGPRMVLSKAEDSDARPSLITENSSYFEVFSGKIDHSIWVADEVAMRVKNKLNN